MGKGFEIFFFIFLKIVSKLKMWNQFMLGTQKRKIPAI